MTRAELTARLVAILASEFDLAADEIADDSRLVEDLDLDSIDAVTVVVRLEEELGVALGDQEIEAMRTVGDVVSALAAALGARDPEATRR